MEDENCSFSIAHMISSFVSVPCSGPRSTFSLWKQLRDTRKFRQSEPKCSARRDYTSDTSCSQIHMPFVSISWVELRHCQGKEAALPHSPSSWEWLSHLSRRPMTVKRLTPQLLRLFARQCNVAAPAESFACDGGKGSWPSTSRIKYPTCMAWECMPFLYCVSW